MVDYKFKGKAVKCYTLKAKKTGKIYTTCKETKQGFQLRKGQPQNPYPRNIKPGVVKKAQKKIKNKIRRRPPPPPPPPSRSVQMNMLRRGINPDAPIFM
tara:strand:- start:479 stop:775 length:297 start_codon:yes stop_codon:yes gene_type:complete